MRTMLIVEDDENLSRGIAFAFEKEGYSVIMADTKSAAWDSFCENESDIILLDIGLPDGSGMELCERIRKISSVPIIMLTARDMETDEVAGFLSGADDYITKPFSLSVLRARVDAISRRRASDGIRLGGIRLESGRLYRDGVEVALSATELRLAKHLMRNAGQILPKENILAALWDSHGSFVDENTLSVNISRLRAKLEDNPKNPKIIKTIHGLGYMWVKE